MNAVKKSGATLSDAEIKEYLESRDWEVDAMDAVMDILNTSSQIMYTEYDMDSSEMTIITKDNVFKFKWKLKKYSGGMHD